MFLQIQEPTINESKEERELVLGIDLGTTNSVVSCVKDGIAQVIGDIYPSIYRNVKSIKRKMGSNNKVTIDEMEYSPVEISSQILLELKNRTEEILEKKVNKVVITVPAHFDDAARNDTKLAAYLAGFEVLRLINEPTAAALAYGLDSSAEGIYLIYDFGGGTFDVSILKMSKGIFQVLATGGDNNLGGDDIDQKIAEYLKIDNIAIARDIKESFTNKGDLEKVKPYKLTKEEFNNIALPFVNRTIRLCKETIEESSVDIKSIKEIVLVGGSTRLELVKQRLKEELKTPLDSINPDIVVALGAAISADSLVNGSNNLLLDVNSLSIGLEVMGGLNEKIILKNSQIPISVTKNFTTYEDGQTGMIFHITQGEREMAANCRSLAKFELKNIPPMKASLPKVAVTFSLDADGILTVSAIEEISKVKQSIEMKTTYGISKEDAERMIDQSYLLAKEDYEAKNLAQVRLRAEGNVKNLIKIISENPELIEQEEKEKILQLMAKIDESLKENNYITIDDLNSQLEESSMPIIKKYIDKQISNALKGKSTDEFI